MPSTSSSGFTFHRVNTHGQLSTLNNDSSNYSMPSPATVYATCVETHGADASAETLLECFTTNLPAMDDNNHADIGARDFARQVLLVYAAALVFFMQAGFAMVCAGAVRKKNVQNTMLKNLLDACGAAVAFFTVGYAFAFGGMDEQSPHKDFVGSSNFFLMDVHDLGFWLFQYAFSAASATIVAGTLAERCQMAAYLCYSVMLTGWVYPIIVHAIWNANGFLSAFNVDPLWGTGVIDFAGSGVVHLTGGITALFATLILGPRRGRFHDDEGRKLEVPREIQGHSVALQMLGTFILWFGWYGFNCGSALLLNSPQSGSIAALAGVNSTLSAGFSGIVSLLGNLWYLERYTGEAYFDLKYAMNGALSGLVAVTAGCGVIEPWAAAVMGAVAGVLYIFGSRGLVWVRLDDAVDAIPVHMMNGIWGLIGVGLFASPSRLMASYGRDEHPGFMYSLSRGSGADATLLGTQLVGILFIVGWVMCIMLPFFVWLDWRGWFRSDPLEEIVGLDTSYHGGLVMMTGGDEEDGGGVNPEYISALREQRAHQNKNGGSHSSSLRRRHPHHHHHVANTNTSSDISGGFGGGGGILRGTSPHETVSVEIEDDDDDYDDDEEEEPGVDT